MCCIIFGKITINASNFLYIAEKYCLMKNYTPFLLCLIIPFSMFSQQNIIVEKGYMSLTDEAKDYYQKSLPTSIDISGSNYFPPIYQQTHWVCNQVATCYYMMSYETNKIKGISSDSPENQFSVYFPWNFGNGGNGWFGDNYIITMELMKKLGVPKLSDSQADALQDSSLWLNGYENYYSLMHNKIDDYLRIETNTISGLTTLKAWIFDNCSTGEIGGTATFLANIAPEGATYFVNGTPEAGEYVITKCGDDALHARTIVGYNDNVCFDYNGDGEYTNDVDLNNDGFIDVRDYEKGGFKLAESFGPDWEGGGFCWIMYKCMADSYPEGGILNNYVHVIKPNVDYSPQLTAKVLLKHVSRQSIKVKVGISSDLNSSSWEYITDFPIVNYQGGDKYMCGGTSEADKTIEIGLDISSLLEYFNEDSQARLFLVVEESDPNDIYEGDILEFSVLDYTSGVVHEFTNGNPISLSNDASTVIYTDVTIAECDVPRILTSSLPVLSSENPVWFELEYEGGKPPYKWELLPNFKVEHFDEDFDSFDGIKLTPDNNYNGTLLLDLPFLFPFDNIETNQIRIHTDGYIIPSSETNAWTQFRENLYPLFINESLIAPLARFSLKTDFLSGDGIWYKYVGDTVKIRWKASDNNAESWTSIRFGCELIADGTITFSYGTNYLRSIFSNIGGVSFGNQSDNVIAWMDDIPSNGSKIKISPFPIPQGLRISPEGVLYGELEAYNSYPFRVKITDANNVSHTVKYELTTGMEEFIVNQDVFRVYPNPAFDYINVELNNQIVGNSILKIFNSKGEIVSTIILTNQNSLRINLDNYNSGIYYIELNNNNGDLFYNKFVKI